MAPFLGAPAQARPPAQKWARAGAEFVCFFFVRGCSVVPPQIALADRGGHDLLGEHAHEHERADERRQHEREEPRDDRRKVPVMYLYLSI